MLCAHYFLIKGKELFGRPNSKPAITLNHGWICYHREWEIFFLPLNHYALDTLLANILRRLISLWTVLLVTVNNTIQWKNRDCITGYYAMIVILDDVRRLRCVCPDFQKKSILVGNIVVWYRTQSPFFYHSSWSPPVYLCLYVSWNCFSTEFPKLSKFSNYFIFRFFKFYSFTKQVDLEIFYKLCRELLLFITYYYYYL